MPGETLKTAPAEFQSQVKEFDSEKLRHRNDSVEKQHMSNMQDIVQEKTADVRDELAKFDANKLKRTSTEEHNTIPDLQNVVQEKTADVREEVLKFDAAKLKETKTEVKNTLPTKEVIDSERNAKA